MDRAEALNLEYEVRYALTSSKHKQAVDVAFTALREQSEWISVEERLPDPFVSVLGYCPDEDPLPTVHECYLSGYGQWCSAQVYGMEKVTHWMPLPEPPEEGAEK